MYKKIKHRLTALVLAAVSVLGLSVPVQAASIDDGSKTCTVKAASSSGYSHLTTTTGTTLGATGYTYTTNDGLTGPAYCIDFGLSNASSTKSLPITGKYTASPSTAGAFASGYPQLDMDGFMGLYLADNSILSGLTEPEYRSATQLAIWATLGQLGIEGTSFTSGRERIAQPTGDVAKMRIFRAAQLIAINASTWDRVYQTGMYIRLKENELGGNVAVPSNMTLDYAASTGQYGLNMEVINGKNYYTKEYIFASATSTYHQGYTIDLWATGAPSGTMFTDLNNVELTGASWHGTTTWRLPVEIQTTNINSNGFEYYGKAKLCIPVDNVPPKGEIKVHCAAQVMQYEIYLAENSAKKEQSYIIADPSKGSKEAEVVLSWGGEQTETGKLEILKVGGGGSPLAEAVFTLTGTDGSSRTGTTDDKGKIFWEGLRPDITYTLTETTPPPGYGKVEPMTVTVKAGQTVYLTIKDDTEHTFTVRKIDRQDGRSLQGAIICFEMINAAFKTTGTTDQAGYIQFNADELPVGSYKVYELTAPEGYELDPTIQTVHWDGKQDMTLTFRNTRKPTLIISKVEAGTLYSLPDATFEIYKDGKLVTTATTDANGLAYVSGLTSGYYQIKEIVAPAGHILNPKVYDVFVDQYDPATEEDPRITVENDALVSLRIIKYDRTSHKPMAGVSFVIFRDAVSLGLHETDQNGEIFLTDLQPGTYRVAEVDTGDDVHILDATIQEIELHANDATRELYFFNDKKPGMHLIKVDSADPDKVIPGAVFEIKSVAGDYGPEEFTTDQNGEIDLSKLPEGSYIVTEKSCAGYVVDDAQRIIELRANQTSEFVFTNTKKPGLRLIKTSADGTPLDGVTFKITPIGDASHSIDRTTANGGEIFVEDLEPGVYSVVETATLPDHILDTTEYHVELIPGKTAELRLQNVKKPLLTISKTDADTGVVVPGTVFEVKGIDSSYQDDWTTGADGKVAKRVDPGTYQVTEKYVPAPYYLPDKDADRTQTISLSPGDEKTLFFKNHRTPELTIYKVDSVAGAPIEGAKFHVTYTSNGESADAPASVDFGLFITDSLGEIRLHEKGKKLYPGEYTVTEIEPAPGFQMKEPSTQKVILHGGESRKLTFANEPLNAVVVEKYDSVTHAALPGCTFQLRYLSGTSGTGGTVIGTKVTGNNGTAIWTGLKAGAYIIEEIDPADGYSIINASETVYLADSGEQSVITVRFNNSPDGSLLVRKVCSVNPSVALQDAEFKITYSDGTLIGDSNGIFKSDENGEILIEGLKPGKSVVVTEVKAPAGFIIDTQPQTIQIKEGRTVSLTFKNQPRGKLIVQKRDSVTGQPLPGAEFRITTAAGCEVGLDGVIGTATMTQNGLFTTDAQGEIRISNLAPGAYVLTEIKAPDGYVMDSPSTNVVIGSNGDTQTVIVTNTKKGNLIVEKYDSVTKQPLKGAQFKITTANGELVASNEGLTSSNGLYETNENGQIVLSKLLPGTYIVTETKAPDNYQIDPKPQTVVVNAGDTQTLRFYDDPLCTLTILKRDSVTKKPLKGAEFTVKDSEGRDIGKYITGVDGTATVSGLTPNATIVVSESKAPTGYIKDETSKNIVVRTGTANGLTIDNEPTTTLIIQKFIEGTENEPLSGVEFRVTDGSGAAVGPDDGKYYTDKAGEIVLSDLEPGTTVKVREIKTVEGFVLDGTPQDIKIKAGEVQRLTFWNKRAGTLVIQKKDSVTGAFIAGAQFQLAYANGGFVDNDNGHLSSNGLYTTDSKGEIRISGITGTVVAKEVKAAPGYVIDQSTQTQTVTVNPMDTQMLTFLNNPLCSLTITKLDSVTGKPVPNTQFEVRDGNGAVLARCTTGKDGTATVTGLVPGSTVVVVETKVPSGYVLNSTPQTITVKNGANTVSSGTTAGTNGSTSGTNSGNDLVFENDPKTQLVIEKYVTGTTTPLKGVTFLVTESNGKVLGSANGEYTTDKNGRIVIEGLEPGTTIIAKEIETLEGYILDSTPKSIQIKAGEAQTLKFYNQKQGALVIRKLDSVTKKPLAGVEFQLTYADGSYVDADNGHLSSKGLYTTDKAGEIRITGITGTIIATETKTIDGYSIDETARTQTVKVNPQDTQTLVFYNAPIGGLELIKVSEADQTQRISNVKFEIRRMDGGLVDTVTTDKNGRVYQALDKGSYYAVEISCPKEFKLDDTPHYFTIQDGKTTTLTVTNTPFSGIIIHKVDSVTGDGLYDVKFLVYDQNKNPIGEYSTDQDGYIYIDNLTVDGKGKLFIRELEAAPGYELDKEYKTVYVQPGKTIEIKWENTPITGQIQVQKFAAEYNELTGTPAGAPLQGAVYEISEARSGQVVDYITTDARGVAASKPLPLGRYKVVEVTAPTYWQLSGKTFDETLEYSGQIIKVSDYDKPVKLGVTITKRGNAEALAGSQMRYDFTVANTSNVPLSDFYWHDRIPTDATRATVLTTGTYSARLNYRILYKTNYSTAYQVLASNLSTSSSYSFSLNAIPTQAGEYVTEVYFDFGKVPVGFQSVTKPTLTVQILGTVANGYQIINRADVGGRYQDTWQTAQATWVTIVRKLTTTPTLPKTGY